MKKRILSGSVKTVNNLLKQDV